MTFEEKHAQVDEDPAVELRRRLEPWAAAPDSRGQSLDAAIVPIETIVRAIQGLELLQQMTDAFMKAKTKGNA